MFSWSKTKIYVVPCLAPKEKIIVQNVRNVIICIAYIAVLNESQIKPKMKPFWLF